ncbi:MAG: hypothetical protein SFX18_11100 [Pirellulales bacterium]|nr:hypothetical protein [Pirellulales bacterium]
MWQILTSPAGQLVILVTATLGLIMVGFYIAGKLRGYKDRKPIDTGEVLLNFREIHDQGGLSDAEFRNIKTLLSQQVERERPTRKLPPA